jgi:excisionase family DNA binding protein
MNSQNRGIVRLYRHPDRLRHGFCHSNGMQQPSDLHEPASYKHPAGSDPTLGRSVSLDRAARLLQVSRRTIYNHIRSGRLATIRTYGSQRVLVTSIFDFARRLP